MIEVAFENELLEAQLLGDHRVDVECVEKDEDYHKDGKNDVVSFTKDGNNVGFSHHIDEGCISIVDNLQKIVPEGRGYSRAVSILNYIYIA